MLVRATQKGYQGDQLRDIDDEFELDRPEEFSTGWMEPLDEEAKAAQVAREKFIEAREDARRNGTKMPEPAPRKPKPKPQGKPKKAKEPSTHSEAARARAADSETVI